LEKAAHPRYKPCAGGITAAAARELERVFLPATSIELSGRIPTGTPTGMPRRLVERECRGVRLLYDGVERVIRQDAAVAYTVKREQFDEHLIRLAGRSGAVVREREGVLSIERDAKGVTVQTGARSERAPLLIGADGYFSKVRKFAGYGFGRDETLFCVIADIPLPEAEIGERFQDCLTIHYGLLDRGYGWIFPKRDRLSAGIGGWRVETRILPALFRTFIWLHGLRYEGTVRGCFLPVFGVRQRSCADRVILAGDAAGFVDAFTGEGIRFALASGRIAGASAALCHERGDFSQKALEGYEDRWHADFGEDLLRSVRLTEFAFRRKNLFFGIALGNRAVLTRYMKTMTGELRLGELVSWARKRLPVLFAKGAALVVKLRVNAKKHTFIREATDETRSHG
jgi:flavin-dependent dehydrogenase